MTTEGAQTAEKVALTDAEREALRERVRHNWPFEDDADTDDEITDVADGVAVAVARIKAEAVDRERAAWATKIEALAGIWEADDEEHLNRFGQHLMGGSVLSCSEHLRALLAADDTEGKP